MLSVLPHQGRREGERAAAGGKKGRWRRGKQKEEKGRRTRSKREKRRGELSHCILSFLC